MLNQLNSLKSLSSDDSDYVKTIYRVMREFGYTLEEVRGIPIPHFFWLVKLIKEEDRKIAEANKRRR